MSNILQPQIDILDSQFDSNKIEANVYIKSLHILLENSRNMKITENEKDELILFEATKIYNES